MTRLRTSSSGRITFLRFFRRSPLPKLGLACLLFAQLAQASHIVFDVSGQAGQHGQAGISAGYNHYETHGGDAGQGSDATSAGEIHLRLQSSADPQSPVVVLSGMYRPPNGQGSQDNWGAIASQYPLSADLGLILKAQGAAGGNGGRGGDGGPGSDGRRGQDASRYSAGTNGGPGGNGGSGGRGGDGGNASSGGRVAIYVSEDDADLLALLVEPPSLAGGVAGKGGSGGRGGEGGRGGAGGSSHSWTTSYTTYVHSGRTTIPMHHTQHHSNPGGSYGPSGYRGRDGGSGRDGAAGQPGQFDIHLYDHSITSDAPLHVYHGVYDINVVGVELSEQYQDATLEPGEVIEASVTVCNQGGMPTPARHDIVLDLADNQWVQSLAGGTITLPRGLTPGQCARVSKPLQFAINRPLSEPLSEALHATLDLQFYALVGRYPKALPVAKAPGVGEHIAIGFPVKITGFKAPASIGPGEEAPLVWKITNSSSKSIGSESEGKRLVATHLQVAATNATDLSFRDEHGRLLSSAEELSKNIRRLGPHESVCCRGTVAFHSNTANHCRLDLAAILKLAAVGKEGVNHNIQLSQARVQYEQGYDPTAASDVLVVMNHAVAPEELDAWTSLLTNLGLKSQFWNLSYYKGLDFGQELQEGHSLLQSFKGKLVLILDYAYRDSLSGEDNQALSQIKLAPFFELLAKPEVASYIVSSRPHDDNLKLWPLAAWPETNGSPLDEPVDESEAYHSVKEFLKAFDKGEAATSGGTGQSDTIVVRKKGHESAAGRLRAKISEASKELLERVPDKNFLFVYTPREDDAHSVGTVTIMRLLDLSEVNLQIRRGITTGDQTYLNGPQNLRILLRALPFSHKLTLWERLLGEAEQGLCDGVKEEMLQGLTDVIVGDLLGEQAVFRGQKHTGDLDETYLAEHLPHLTALGSFRFTAVSMTSQGRRARAYMELAQTLDRHFEGVLSTADRWLFNRRQKFVSHTSKEILRRFLAQAFGSGQPAGDDDDDDEEEDQRKEIWQAFKKLRKSAADDTPPETLLREMQELGPLRQHMSLSNDGVVVHEVLSKDDYLRKLAYLRAQGRGIVEGLYHFKDDFVRRRQALEGVERGLLEGS